MTYPPTPTFWLDPTGNVAVGLRRYSRGPTRGNGWTCAEGFHQALVFTGTEPAAWLDTDHGRMLDTRPEVAHDDPRWPVECARGCGYQFTDDDAWQSWQELLYQRADTGALRVLHQRNAPPDAPSAEPGATWDAWWWPPVWRGPDSVSLMVRLPDGHDWAVDAEASNCTRKGDTSHKCWVRHGDPRLAQVTVDKAGETCAAGAGSIASSGYHGFLQAGVLTAG